MALTCRVCGSNLVNLLPYKNMPPTGIDFNVCQCTKCELIQLDCEPIATYREVVRTYSPHMMELRREQFSKLSEEYGLNKKKVLEVGCGRGEIVELLNSVGMDGYGIEWNSDGVIQSLEKGLSVSRMYLDANIQLKLNHSLDAFIILNFLEHFPDPNTLLKVLYDNTTADMVGVVEVPNFDMVKKHSMFAEFTAEHLLYFTEDTLRRTLECHGFKIIKIESIYDDYILTATIQKIGQQQNIDNFVNKQFETIQQIEDFIKPFETVVVYGAGHQSFAILSIVKSLANKTRYIIDDAKFKQNTYSPISNIPIISFEAHLNQFGIDAIIIIAGSYSKEILNKIGGYPQKLAVLEPFGLQQYIKIY